MADLAAYEARAAEAERRLSAIEARLMGGAGACPVLLVIPLAGISYPASRGTQSHASITLLFFPACHCCPRRETCMIMAQKGGSQVHDPN